MRGKLLSLVSGMLATLTLVALMGQTGGFPSRPRFQAVGIGQVANATSGTLQMSGVNPILRMTESDGAANNRVWDFNLGTEVFEGRVIDDAISAAASWLTIQRTANTVDSIALAATNLTVAGAQQINSGTAVNAFDVNSTAAGGPNTRYLRSGSTFADIGNGGQMGGTFTLDALAFVARAGNAIQMAAGGATTPHFAITSAGVVQANGSTVWTAGNDGAGSGLDADTLDALSSAAFVQQDAARTNFVARSGSVTSRTSDATNTCDANLTLSLPNDTADYSLYAFLDFDGNGITANGWSVLPGASTGTISVNWVGIATTNTTAANAAPTSNTGASGGDMDAVFNAAGVATYVTISGVVRVTAGAAPAFCIAWGQTASNATATDLNIGSNIVLTRLN